MLSWRSMLLGTAAIVLLAAISVGIVTASRGATNPEQELLELQRQRSEAMVGNDYAALDKILSDDLTWIHSTGVVESKDQFIDALKSGRRKYESIEVKELDVRMYGDSAILTGAVFNQVRVGGELRSFNLRFTDVYVKREGNWQTVAWQSTTIPQQQ